MSTPTRRRFLQAAAVGAALPLVADAAAQEPPATAAQALQSIVRLRYRYLTEDQLKAVQQGLEIGQASAEILKRVRLDPTDEPCTVFVADLAE